ncbi:MAG: ComF family protein [Spirochaetales bacterium]|nr:ComF family protein [Spirochaetales bacterium]
MGIKKVITLILPERCILCGEIITDKTNFNPLCSACEAGLASLQGNVCSTCGFPLISEVNNCLRCREVKFNYLSNRSVFKYHGSIKEIIYQYKFNNRKSLSFYFAKILSDVLINNYPGSIIVPVPGRKIVRKNRGWEHIDLIGKILKHKYKLPVQKLLIRKGKKAQKTLSRENRAENLRKSIRIQKNIKTFPASVVLLDDVFTTGTTINECAGILKSAGVEKIYSLTIAID